MKQILVLGTALMFSLAPMSQNNVTRFLGIPIDGTKSAMIQKLKAKGFTYSATSDELSGEFNGRSVNLHVVTNNNKVYRIMVADAYGSSEGDIKNRFNTLCGQFKKNGHYLPAGLVGDFTIGEEEDISYEMSVHNKRYEAAYYQVADSDKDTTGLAKWAVERISSEYGWEKWDSMSEEERTTAGFSMGIEFMLERVRYKSVWFMISERYGRYYINIYYDNEKNQANGEDL